MPKYESKLEFFKAKYEGQLARCEDQQQEIKGLHQQVADLTNERNLLKRSLGQAQRNLGVLRDKNRQLIKDVNSHCRELPRGQLV